MIKNKKGAETTIGTIVVVILAVLVLIVVVAGFSMGWKNLWGQVNIFTPAAQSVDAVVSACDARCLTNQKYSYCCDEVKVKDIAEDKGMTCTALKKTEKLPITCETIDCGEVTCKGK